MVFPRGTMPDRRTYFISPPGDGQRDSVLLTHLPLGLDDGAVVLVCQAKIDCLLQESVVLA